MVRIRLFVSLMAAMSILAPLSSAARGTPEATPTVTCAFPPISIELLREIRDDIAANPPPTPTTAAEGYSSSRTHLIQFPPPPGEPLDEATHASVERFVAAYEPCIVGGDFARTYGAWTEDFIRRTVGPNLELVEALIMAMNEDAAVFAHPSLSLLLLRAWEIDSGHVVAVVQIVGADQYWTWLLLPVGDSWRIDDLWNIEPELFEGSLTGPIYATPITGD